MKKITLFIAFAITTISAFAQTILNPGFETWVSNSEATTTYQMPEHWVTHDVVLSYLNEQFGNPGYAVNSVTQVAGHSGNDAVQMGVGISTYGDTVSGGIFYCDSAIKVLEVLMGGGEMLGFPCTGRPANFTGWYKWNNVGNDSAQILFVLTKWNSTNQSRDTIGGALLDFQASVTPWTSFTMPVGYSMNVYPDTAFIYAANNSTRPSIGSLFTIDDLAFTGTAPIGINETVAPSHSAVVMPNPFNDQATLSLKDAQISNGKMEIYDVLGNKVRHVENLSGNNFIISREGLPAGIYFYTLSEENALIATGKISVE